MLAVPDGRSVRTLINATPIRVDGGEVGSVVVTMQDLAPLDEFERMRTEFPGLVSRELRAPLIAIKGSADTLLEEAGGLDRTEMREFYPHHRRPSQSHGSGPGASTSPGACCASSSATSAASSATAPTAEPRWRDTVADAGNRKPRTGGPPVSDHDALDLVDRDGVCRPVIELRRLRRGVRRDLLRPLEGAPVRQDTVIPVARNVWQHVDGGSPAAAARRLIIARTTRRCSARPVNRRPAGSTLWKTAFGSSNAAASRYSSRAAAARWWAGTSCRFPPFSWSRSHPWLSCPK